jgi:hypothetical protein
MEENTKVEAPKKATDTIVKKGVHLVVGAALAEEGEQPLEFYVATFCFAKTVRAFALLTELAEAAGVGKVVDAADKSGVEGEFDNPVEKPVAPGFIQQLVTILPKALRDGIPAAHKLIGLIVTSNKELARMEDDEEDVDEALRRLGRRIAREGSTEEVLGVIAAGAQVMGIETIVKNLMPLMGMLRR